MNIKKYLVISVLVLLPLVCMSTLALALYQPPMIVQINANGGITLRGNIAAIAANNLTVKSWGGSWSINILPSTNFMPGKDMSQFQIGDFVGVQGSMNQSSPWDIDATLVRDWTYRKVQNNNLSISGVSGSTTLNVNQAGNWTINVNNTQNANLSYYVVWGDEKNYAAPVTTNANGQGPGILYVQTATFTHSYAYAGIYSPKFYVKDNLGNISNVSISINVGNAPILQQTCTSDSQCSNNMLCLSSNYCGGTGPSQVEGSLANPGTCQLKLDCNVVCSTPGNCPPLTTPPPINNQCNVKPDSSGKCPTGCVNYGNPLGCVTQEYEDYCSSNSSQCPK